MHPPVRLYAYLALARTKLFDWVRPLTDEQYRAEHPIGLGSIARTLHHVKGAEASYMRRLIGHTEMPPAPAHENNPGVTTESALPFAQLEPLWIAQARDTQAALERVTDWSTPAVYQTTWDGAPFAYRASPADFLPSSPSTKSTTAPRSSTC